MPCEIVADTGSCIPISCLALSPPHQQPHPPHHLGLLSMCSEGGERVVDVHHQTSKFVCSGCVISVTLKVVHCYVLTDVIYTEPVCLVPQLWANFAIVTANTAAVTTLFLGLQARHFPGAHSSRGAEHQHEQWATSGLHRLPP